MTSKHKRKLQLITTVLAVTLLLTTFISGCSGNGIEGEYRYVEPIYRGGISSYYLEPPPSQSYDYLVEKNKDTTYTITKDSIIVEGADYRIAKDNLVFKKDKFKNEYIYGGLNFTDNTLDDLFNKYNKKEIILVNEEGGTRSGYYFLMLDDDVYIAGIEVRGGLIFSLDKIEKK